MPPVDYGSVVILTSHALPTTLLPQPRRLSLAHKGCHGKALQTPLVSSRTMGSVQTAGTGPRAEGQISPASSCSWGCQGAEVPCLWEAVFLDLPSFKWHKWHAFMMKGKHRFGSQPHKVVDFSLSQYLYPEPIVPYMPVMYVFVCEISGHCCASCLAEYFCSVLFLFFLFFPLPSVPMPERCPCASGCLGWAFCVFTSHSRLAHISQLSTECYLFSSGSTAPLTGVNLIVCVWNL